MRTPSIRSALPVLAVLLASFTAAVARADFTLPETAAELRKAQRLIVVYSPRWERLTISPPPTEMAGVAFGWLPSLALLPTLPFGGPGLYEDWQYVNSGRIEPLRAALGDPSIHELQLDALKGLVAKEFPNATVRFVVAPEISSERELRGRLEREPAGHVIMVRVYTAVRYDLAGIESIILVKSFLNKGGQLRPIRSGGFMYESPMELERIPELGAERFRARAKGSVAEWIGAPAADAVRYLMGLAGEPMKCCGEAAPVFLTGRDAYSFESPYYRPSEDRVVFEGWRGLEAISVPVVRELR